MAGLLIPVLYVLGSIYTATDGAASRYKFTTDLYKTLAKADAANKNLAVSPFSVETAMTMTYLGAAGETKSQMASALGIDDGATADTLGKKFSTLRSNSHDFILKAANELFLEKSFTIRPEYKNDLVSKFFSNISPADFKKNAEGERTRINTWVEAQTANKIHDLLPPGSVDGGTKLVLVNAVYFNASWALPFDVSSTSDGDFALSNGQTKKAKLMDQTDNFAYGSSGELGNAQLLELQYKGKDVSMVVILPQKETGLQALENSLTPEALDKALNNLSRNKVHVTLPKFKVESSFSLGEALTSLGIRAAFSDGADFSGISDGERLKISRVEHKVFADVDEKGTEAAAATAVIMAEAASGSVNVFSMPPIEFRADHAFLFLIRHNPSTTILFVGRVTEPTAAN